MTQRACSIRVLFARHKAKGITNDKRCAVSKPKIVTGQALKDFRHSVAVLKRKGLVSKRVDARSQKATRYMQTKVKALQSIIEGTAMAAIPKRKRGEKLAVFRERKREILSKYSEDDILPVKYGVVIVPKGAASEKASIERGMVKVTRSLKNGTQETIILPFKMTALPDLVEKMLANADEIDELKQPDEFFSFRVGENNSQVPFINAEEMATYLIKYYNRLDEPITGTKQTKELLTFQRFKTPNGNFERNPHESGLLKKAFPKSNRKGRNMEEGTAQRQRRRRDAIRKKQQRANESETVRLARLRSNAIRTAQWKQRNFERE